jgi:SAM-dependent methyltransferase
VSEQARRYWDATAAAYTFAHPLNLDWLEPLQKEAHILDYGCGYGRAVAELGDAGWRNTVGVDFSAEMIARGRRENPDLTLRHIEATPIAELDGAFDAAMLFAVLTCIPDDDSQAALVAELRRLLRPGGLLYISDYPLQDDARNRARYEAGAVRHGVYGVWDRDDGGVFRHHTREHLRAMVAGFELVAEREVSTVTLSGAPATAIQLLGRRSGGTTLA